MNRYRTGRNSQRPKDNWDKGFKVWFLTCGIITVATFVAVVWLIIYVLPHIVHMLDRIH